MIKTSVKTNLIAEFNKILQRSNEVEQFEDYASDFGKFSRKVDALNGSLMKLQSQIGKNSDQGINSAKRLLPIIMEACTEIDGHLRNDYSGYPEIINAFAPQIVNSQNRSRQMLAYIDETVVFNNKNFLIGLDKLRDSLNKMAESFDAYSGYFYNAYSERNKIPPPPKSRKTLIELAVIAKHYSEEFDKALYLPFQSADSSRIDPNQIPGAILELGDELNEALDPFYDHDSKRYIDDPRIQNELLTVITSTTNLWKFIRHPYTQRSLSSLVVRDIIKPLQRCLTYVEI